MAELKQNLISDFLKHENVLRKEIKNIESCLKADVVVYRGIIEPVLADQLIEVIKDMSVKQDKRKTLALIVTSPGGSFESVSNIFTKIYDGKLYDKVYIIANGMLLSAGTILSFFADKLFAINNPTFGMIDPQSSVFDTVVNKDISVSAFVSLKCYDIRWDFNEKANEIENSITFLNDGCRYPRAYNHNEQTVIDRINQVRKISFDALIKHNLKGVKNNKKKAIKLINSLMISEVCNHNSSIDTCIIQKMGLRLTEINDIESQLYQ